MGTGGKRPGSGRPGWRRKAETMLYLDIREWARKGWLAPGFEGTQHWTRGTEQVGATAFIVGADSVRLRYARHADRTGAAPITMCYEVRLDRTACVNIGGARPWFLCPRCSDRRAVLYGLAVDGYFGCTRCLNLVYASEGEIAVKRAWRKQLKLEAQLRRKRPDGKAAKRIAARIKECEARRLTPLRTKLDPGIATLRDLLSVGDLDAAARFIERVAKRAPLEAVCLYLVVAGAPSA